MLADSLDHTVLVLAPLAGDASAIVELLESEGIPAIACTGLGQCLQKMAGGAGTLLLTEEALESGEVPDLLEALKAQPAWSELPLIVVARGGEARMSTLLELVAAASGNVTVLERPMGLATLARCVQVALRARRRQYQVRDLLGELSRGLEERQRLLESERWARTEAERATRLKDEFLATVSHELRSPLHVLLAWASVLQRSETDAATRAEGLAIMQRSAQTQARLIEDLLDLSRIMSGKMRLEIQTVDLAGVIRDALETVRASAQAKNIRIECVTDPSAGPIQGDPNRLQQVIWNLLSNAVKFTPSGGRVQAHLVRVEGAIEIRVIDDGKGINPEFLPHVFERFRQEDSSTVRRYGGLGLGLSIVKHLAELHGGTVKAESLGEGYGSTFAVRLPAANLEAARQVPPSKKGDASLPSGGLANKRVLIVDDDVAACEVMRRALLDCQAKVYVAHSVSEALEMLTALRPDLLVSDIGMPEKDGYDLIQAVRQSNDPELAAVPAVAVTAYAREQDRGAALEAGFDAHLTKPLQPDKLVASVASLARRSRPRQPA